MPKVIGIMVILLVIAGGWYFLFNKPSSSAPSVQTTVYSQPTMVPSAPTTNTFSDPNLGYSFEYPAGEVYKCPDAGCALINQYSLRIEPLTKDNFDPSDPQGLLTQDLFCSASGPGVNQTCKNTQVTKFTNPAGATGYKVERTQTVSGGANAGSKSNPAFVFPLKSGGTNTAVLFAVDTPNASNSAYLQNLVNTVKISK